METTEPWDVYQQFNNLIAESPYLSNEVLIEMINNPAFTSLMVKLVMLANPHGKESFEVMDALENRLPAMPQSYIDEIKNQVSAASQLKVLEGNVAVDYHLISNISEDIKRMYKTDTLNAWAKDSLINFVSRQPDLYDKYELATLYLSYGLYTEMQTVLNTIPQNFEMDDEMTTEFNEFSAILSIAKTMQDENLYEGGLNETQRGNLENLLEAGKPILSPMALSLLMRDDPNYNYEERIDNVDQNAPLRLKPNDENSSSDEQMEFMLYPNPALDYTTLKYNCKYANLTYSIIEASGKIIKSSVLETIEDTKLNEVLIDLSSINSGTYYLVIKTNGKSIWTEKLIISE